MLFDFGSGHTLIYRTFVNSIGGPIDDLGYDLVVSSPTGAVLTTREGLNSIVVII